MGLENKKKALVIGNTEEQNYKLKVDVDGKKQYEFERMYRFVYLGVVIKEHNRKEQGLRTREAKGNQKFSSLRILMTSKYVTRRIYRTVINGTEEDMSNRRKKQEQMKNFKCSMENYV